MLTWTNGELLCLAQDKPYTIFMLDHDPVLAATYHADHHVATLLPSYLRLLCAAWHVVANPCFDVLPDDPADDVEAMQLKLEVYAPGAAPSRVEEFEQRISRWILFDQWIMTLSNREHPCVEWVSHSGGNYRWLWRLSAALFEEHNKRFAKQHQLLPMLWTLEELPPALIASREEWSEVPLIMPEQFKVVVDGCYDAVKSYRSYYAGAKQPLHHWTRRNQPLWLQEVQS